LSAQVVLTDLNDKNNNNSKSARYYYDALIFRCDMYVIYLHSYSPLEQTPLFITTGSFPLRLSRPWFILIICFVHPVPIQLKLVRSAFVECIRMQFMSYNSIAYNNMHVCDRIVQRSLSPSRTTGNGFNTIWIANSA